MPFRRIAKFAIVGAIGFAIDAGVLTLAVRELSSVYTARALSFSCAVLATWLLNRLYVFEPDKRASLAAEYGRYLATQVAGALTNLAGYRITYGRSASTLDQSINVTNPGLTTYVVPNLGSGTWYFAMYAYTSTGAESDASNVATKTVN